MGNCCRRATSAADDLSLPFRSLVSSWENEDLGSQYPLVVSSLSSSSSSSEGVKNTDTEWSPCTPRRRRSRSGSPTRDSATLTPIPSWRHSHLQGRLRRREAGVDSRSQPWEEPIIGGKYLAVRELPVLDSQQVEVLLSMRYKGGAGKC